LVNGFHLFFLPYPLRRCLLGALFCPEMRYASSIGEADEISLPLDNCFTMPEVTLWSGVRDLYFFFRHLVPDVPPFFSSNIATSLSSASCSLVSVLGIWTAACII
jgi:hypothetical protein